jgi:hypothetical protein
VEDEGRAQRDARNQSSARALLSATTDITEDRMSKQQPEALAEFAESARKTPKTGGDEDKSLTATEHTKPIPTDNARKHDAATKILHEGATGEDEGSEEAVEALPDRITQSR